MEAVEKVDVKKVLERSEALVSEAKSLLDEMGIEYKLDEWLTVKRYCERFGIKDTHVVTNWMRRGVIPAENIKEVEELNGLKLIKAVPYK